ncbi:unnamed protein product, partial [Mesorhabditis belari]|uniref:Sex-determining region Y protein n=1 Tax=Mesorhabditis belari TaxID=2138241 RepID=A0AAF3J1L5_9BILA
MNIDSSGTDPASIFTSMFLQQPSTNLNNKPEHNLNNINGAAVLSIPTFQTYPTTTAPTMNFIQQPQNMNGASLYATQLGQPHQQHVTSQQLIAQQIQNQQQNQQQQQQQQQRQQQQQQQQQASDSSVFIKRPQNPFILWATAKRADVLKQYPKISMRDANAMLGSMWKALSDEEKRPFFDQAKQSRADHKLMLSQNPHLMVKPIKVQRSSSGVDTGARARELMQQFPQVYKPPQAGQNLPPMTLPNGMSTAQFPPNMTVGQVLNAPHFTNNQFDKNGSGRQFVKRPPNPYMCFVLEKRGDIVKANPKMRMCDINCILGEMWKMLSEEDKRPYFEQSQRSKEEHKQLLNDNPHLAVKPVKVKKNAKMAREVLNQQHPDVYQHMQQPQQSHQRQIQVQQIQQVQQLQQQPH